MQEVLDAPAKVAEYSPVDAGLVALQKKYGGVQFDVSTVGGDKAARAARQECVKLRTSVEAIRKDTKAPLLERIALLDGEAKRITAAVREVEEPIDAQIKAEEQRKSSEKAERERIERERQEVVARRIQTIAGYAVEAVGKSAVQIAVLRTNLEDEEIDVGDYGDRAGEALALQTDVLTKLDQMHAAAVAQEQEAARLAAEREELARQKAEQERQQAEQERQAKAARDAEDARLREERAALEAERQAEQRRQAAARDEEAKRQQAAAAEQRRAQEELDRQRREFEAAQAAARRAEQEKAEAAERQRRAQAEAEREQREAEEAAARAEQERREREQFAANGPGDVEIVRTLAAHYRVTAGDVMGWLKKFDYAATDEHLAAENVRAA